ncbi:hypothetical protein BN975_05121 [Mycolicibacterium farcinogenes]|nr:hypothetical protein BN975_05121 [Mycolicibacterium farcinogenes]
MGFQGPDQLAAFAFGAQCGIDLEEGFAGELHHLARHAGRGGQVVVTFTLREGLAHEDDVDVADVIQLARTTLAHRYDGQPGLAAIVTHHSGGHGQCCAQRRVSQVGQVCGDLDEGQHGLVLDRGSHIERGQHQQVISVEIPQCRHGTACAPVDLGVAGGGGESVVQLRDSGERDVAVEQAPRLGVGDEVVTEGQGGSEDAEQPAPKGPVGEQATVELVRGGLERVGQPHHGQQCHVGVGCPGQ